MKKQFSTITLSLALMSSLIGFSQNPAQKIPCYTDEAMEEHFKNDPAARTRYEAARVKLNEDIKNNTDLRGRSAAATVYTVPVVFHVLHDGGTENISDATIIGALDFVNKDYARTNPDASLTAAPYSSIYISSDIKFMLAKKDPSGNCITGIVRHVDPVKMNWSQSAANSASYWSYTWDPTKYLNVYIVANIVAQGTVAGGGQIVGYTYIPGTWGTGDARDAIVFHSGFVGSDPRSLGHEMGHWLSLKHIWGSTNAPAVSCGDDGIADTPPTMGALYTCPSSIPGFPSSNTCAGSGGYDNVQNIMNYCNCPINFTQNQTAAMRTTLAGATSGRNNIPSNANLIATDVAGVSPCAPIAEFLSTNNSYTVCSGGSLTMKDFSYNGTVTAYSWSADGGAVVTAPTASSTAINFPTIGTSVVTFSVSNAQGGSVKSRTVTVLDGNVGIPGGLQYNESFEAVGTPSNWTVINPNAGSVTWAQTAIASSDGASSFFIEGATNPPNHIDYLQMPVINPMYSPVDTSFSFKYAFQRYNSVNSDNFKVEASTDCGGNWQTILSLSSAQMGAASAGSVSSNPFSPAANQWVKVDISSYPQWQNIKFDYPSVLVRFTFQEGAAGFGNRFFLDQLNLTVGTVGLNEVTKSIQFNMYPNPTSSESIVRFNLSDAANIKISVTDLLGKEVLPSIENMYAPGEQKISINKNNTLGKGIYFVNLSLNGAKMCKKLVIQ